MFGNLFSPFYLRNSGESRVSHCFLTGPDVSYYINTIPDVKCLWIPCVNLIRWVILLKWYEIYFMAFYLQFLAYSCETGP